jgi:cysteine synthase
MNMDISKDFCALVGNTPLLRLNKASEATGCEILGKAEFLNPGQSVKDRAALSMVLDAEKRGTLNPGGLIVEGTAGNTGIGLALVALARGYRTLIVMPETQSQEKQDALRLCGARLQLEPAKPYKDPGNYVRVSERVAKELAETEPHGVLWANQWDNLANRQAHYEGTGPEIWRQTEGKVDAFVSAIGTGGTLSGTGMFLKEQNPDIRVVLADPPGAAMFNYFAHGELKSDGSSITEGIGQGRVTGNVDGALVDDQVQISDSLMLETIFDLAQNEGHILGGSSGVNLAGAIHTAKQMGPGHTIVTMLCDYGHRYFSKLYNPTFLRAKDLPVPTWLE